MNEKPIVFSGELAPLNGFVSAGLISDVLYRLKSGKEATVFCCRAGPAVNSELVGAKIYRPNRSFKNDAIYQEGRIVLDTRARRAVAKKSRFGKAVKANQWIGHEYDIMQKLYEAGADVPRPIKQDGNAILMEYIGDQEGPAPMLRDVRVTREEATSLFKQLIDNVQLLLSCNYIHGDLSAYNMLYWDDKLIVIDFPQVVDVRQNRHSRELLFRDLENVYRYFSRFGVEASPRRITDGLWHKFMRGTL